MAGSPRTLLALWQGSALLPGALLVLLSIAISGCAGTAQTGKTAVEVCQVLDGDTFRTCDNRHIRLWGIDAPELGEFYYTNASQLLRTALEGRTVRLDQCHPVEHFQVCRVTSGRADISRYMVREGAAYDWPRFSHGYYHADEAAAKTRKKGFWAANNERRTHWSRKALF